MATFTPGNRPDVEVFVDDEDLDRVMRHSWYVKKKDGYVATTIDKKHILLHRFVMGVTDPRIRLDHKNRNRLDNQKSNLRVATVQENAWNRVATKRSSSGYRGVYQCAVTGKWKADIMADGQRMNLGRYATAEDAARVRDAKARELFGEFAGLNFPNEEPAQVLPETVTKKKNSVYRGVYFCATFEKWTAVVFVNKQQVYAGRHDDEHSAALALRRKLEEVCPERLKLKRHTNLPTE